VQSRYRSSLDIDLTHMQRWPPSRFVTSSLTSCGRIPILNCRGPIHSGGNEKVVSIHSGGVPIHNGGVSIHSRGMRYDPCRTTTTAGHGIPVSPLHDIVSLQSFIMRVNHPFIAPPPRLQSRPYCNTIARPLRNIHPSTDPPFICQTPYNVGDGNIV